MKRSRQLSSCFTCHASVSNLMCDHAEWISMIFPRYVIKKFNAFKIQTNILNEWIMPGLRKHTFYSAFKWWVLLFLYYFFKFDRGMNIILFLSLISIWKEKIKTTTKARETMFQLSSNNQFVLKGICGISGPPTTFRSNSKAPGLFSLIRWEKHFC